MFKEDFDKAQEGLRVLEKDGRFYLKLRPDILYDSKVEAEKRAKEYKDTMIFF